MISLRFYLYYSVIECECRRLFRIASESLGTAGQVNWGEPAPTIQNSVVGEIISAETFWIPSVKIKWLEQSHGETDSRSAGQRNFCLLWNPNVNYHVLTRSRHWSLSSASPSCSVSVRLVNIVLSFFTLSLFHSDFRNKLLYVFFVSPIHITCPAHIFLLKLITQYILLSLVRTVYKPVLGSWLYHNIKYTMFRWLFTDKYVYCLWFVVRRGKYVSYKGWVFRKCYYFRALCNAQYRNAGNVQLLKSVRPLLISRILRGLNTSDTMRVMAPFPLAAHFLMSYSEGMAIINTVASSHSNAQEMFHLALLRGPCKFFSSKYEWMSINCMYVWEGVILDWPWRAACMFLWMKSLNRWPQEITRRRSCYDCTITLI